MHDYQINLCYPTLNRYDLLADSINSACKGSLKPTRINIVDNGGKFEENFGQITEVDGIPISVYSFGHNIGVSASWNFFLENLDDTIIISNDDIIFNKDTIELLYRASNENPKEIFFCPTCFWQHEWSCMLQKKSSLNLVGKYDVEMKNHFSDRDYKYRMKLVGIKPFIVKNCNYTHVDGGSQTLRSGQYTSEINTDYEKAMNHYLKKWNGLPNDEIFIKPFGESE